MITASDELITEIADRTIQDGGATYSFASGEYIDKTDSWFYPKYPSLTMIVAKDDIRQAVSDFIDRHNDLLGSRGIYLGTWINPKTNECYIDINTCQADREVALAEARRISQEQGRQILAIYNPHSDESIKVPPGIIKSE